MIVPQFVVVQFTKKFIGEQQNALLEPFGECSIPFPFLVWYLWFWIDLALSLLHFIHTLVDPSIPKRTKKDSFHSSSSTKGHNDIFLNPGMVFTNVKTKSKDIFSIIIFQFSKQCWYPLLKHQTLMNVKWNNRTCGFFVKYPPKFPSYHFVFIMLDLSLFSAPGKCFSDLSQWYVFRIGFPHYKFAFATLFPFTPKRRFAHEKLYYGDVLWNLFSTVGPKI